MSEAFKTESDTRGHAQTDLGERANLIVDALTHETDVHARRQRVRLQIMGLTNERAILLTLLVMRRALAIGYSSGWVNRTLKETMEET